MGLKELYDNIERHNIKINYLKEQIQKYKHSINIEKAYIENLSEQILSYNEKEIDKIKSNNKDKFIYDTDYLGLGD